MSEVFITRKGGGGKASAPELLITDVGGSWIEVEITNTDQSQLAQIFLLTNYDTNSTDDFDFLAIQNGKVITVAAGATATELLQGLNPATTHTISAQAAVIKKLPSNIVTTNPTALLQTGIPVPTIATSNITDFSFNYSVTNNESTIPVAFKIAITTSTAVPTNYPISQTNVGPNATINLNTTNLNAGTTYYIHARALDGTVESNNIFVSVSTLTALYAFTSWTFTNAGKTGHDGPTISQVRSAYSSQSWAQNNAYLSMTTNGIQNWTVPQSGTYRIEAFGAKGGDQGSSNRGGNGARMRGDFSLTRGEVIRILVGQQANMSANGAGGGTYVSRNLTDSLPLIVAGGGGGWGSSGGVATGGTTSTSGLTGGGASYAGGSNGNGGSTSTNSGWGGAGAGWLTNGQDGGIYGGIAFAPRNGGNGGNIFQCSGGFGGFGGGGGGGCNGGGGGGGYSGGGTGGGGGGSYNDGSNQSNSSDAHTGHGQVIITKV